MVSTLHAALSRLRTGEILKIHDGSGQALAVFDGLVWVTQHGDPRDAFVGKGGTFMLDRSGLAVVEAMTETRLAVLDLTAQFDEDRDEDVSVAPATRMDPYDAVIAGALP
jgi:hypothetical protein